MATIFGPGRRSVEPRSGGKIVRARRPTAPRTPYERPPPPPPPSNSDPENPSWLSKLIFSPTRIIATGAGKVLSSFWSDSPSSSSSSSSDDDDDGNSSSDADMDDEHDVSSQDASKMGKTSEISKEPPLVDWKSATKRVIEQLMMQETFSREECDRLTNIIKSRVVDSSIARGTEGDARAALGNDVDIDLRSTAIIEAKRWVEEKKSGSSSKSEFDHGTCTLNTAMLSHDIEAKGGSPVDLAKSYMRARPPWASPSISPTELKSPLPIGMHTFKEGTPYLFRGTSISSSKLNRDSPSTGSWNIQEELRRVRSKATEEMLRTPSSSKINWSALASDYKKSLPVIGKAGGIGDTVTTTQLADAPLNMSSGMATNGLAVNEGSQNEIAPPNPTTSIPEHTQDIVLAMPVIEGRRGILSQRQRIPPSEHSKTASQSDVPTAVDGLKDADDTSQGLGSRVRHTTQDGFPDSKSHEINGLILREVPVMDVTVADNGFPHSVSSLSAGHEIEHNGRASDEERSPVGSEHDRTTSATAEEACYLLSEASVDVPSVDNNEIIVISQDSTSKNQEEVKEDLTRRNTRRSTGKTTGKQPAKKMIRYNRGGKGRGK